MTDENKQPAEFKITKEGLLIVAIISLVILIVYFTLTVADMSVFISLDKDNSNKWGDVLWLLTGVALLLLLYLVVTNRFYGVYRKLIDRYIAFVDQTAQSSQKTQFIMMVIIIALAVVARELYSICSTRWIILSARLSSPAEPLNLRNILIGIAGAVTLGFAWRRLVIVDQQKEAQVKQTNSQVKQTEIESERRLNERFDNAAAALSKELNESSFPAHLGAISSLSVLAINSAENTQRCLDIICSCNQWMEECIEEFNKIESLTPYSSLLLNEDNRLVKKYNQDRTGGITLLHEKRSQEALAAMSHILEKISANNSEQLKELKFHNKMLCGISLRNITLDGINFEETYLVGASLDGASLKKAKLNGANLQDTSLNNVNLQRASLDDANLQRASLWRAEIQGTSLNHANLQGASLWRADLRGASLKHAKLQGVFLDHTNLQGASLVYAKLRGAFLIYTELQGISLRGAELQEAMLINAQLQGATMDKVDLSNAILLDCNLYGTTLKDIKDESIIFNEIVDVGHLKDKEDRKKWLDGVCKYIESYYAKIFTEKMEEAWEAMKNKQEPEGLDTIREKSIVTKDNQGMYDISEDHLANLKKIWKERVQEEGIMFLIKMRRYISSIERESSADKRQITDKNANLVDKLLILINQSMKK